MTAFALGSALALLALAPPGETRVPVGTQGVARTVIEGNRIIEIPVEFVGLYEDAVGPGHDLYLIRLHGAEAERVGVAAGMSGSPVYVGQEIVGAISYRIGVLPKEPIAGVTPIAEMLGAWRGGGPARGRAAGLSPIATPVFASGVAGEVLEHFRPDLERFGFVLVAGGGAIEPPLDAALAPGSPVGIHLVRGDVSIAATGTITWVDGSRVYALGHPLLGTGRVELPMAAAEVVYTLPDAIGSVKLSRVGTEIGAWVEDRLTAVVGLAGERARMIPMRLSVRGGDLPPHEFAFEVARHADLTPALAGTAVASALVRDLGFDQEVTVRATGEVKLRNLPVVPLDLAATSGGGPHPFLAVAGQIQRLLLTLHANPFEEPDVEGVDLDVNVRRERVEYRLEEVHHDRRSVRPGESLRLECVLRSYRGPRESRVLTLTVPPDLLPGTPLALIVGDPSAVDRALGQPLAQRLGSARDLGAWVRVLAEATPADRLEAVLYRPTGGAIVDGLELDDLTPTAAHLLAPREAGARRIASPLVRAAVRLDGPVDGEIRRSLVVDSGARGEESP